MLRYCRVNFVVLLFFIMYCYQEKEEFSGSHIFAIFILRFLRSRKNIFFFLYFSTEFSLGKGFCFFFLVGYDIRTALVVVFFNYLFIVDRSRRLEDVQVLAVFQFRVLLAEHPREHLPGPDAGFQEVSIFVPMVVRLAAVRPFQPDLREYAHQ